MKRRREYIAAIDLGSRKITCIICEVDEFKNLEVIGFGNVEAKGIKRGMIISLEDALESVKQAVEEAEMMSEVSIETAFIGVAGTHIKSFNSNGAVAVTGKHGEINESDIVSVIETAQMVSIPEDREIIHLLPMEFIVDGQSGIVDPFGMSGSRLEVKVHIITGSVSTIKNIISCVNKAGIEIDDIVSNQLASAQATVTEDEKQLGVVVADIGAGTTDVAAYVDGHLEHTAVLPIGGDHFTNDIAVGLRTPIPEAERIKRKFANLAAVDIESDEILTVNTAGNNGDTKKIPMHLLNEILIARTEEVMTMIFNELKRVGHDKSVNAGFVLTGGGSLLEGLPYIAERTFNLPVRIGSASSMRGLSEVIDNPAFSAAVGILQYGYFNISKKPRSPFVKRSFTRKFKETAKSLFASFI